MIASPWYSNETKQSEKETAVYHHNTSCKAGRLVEKNHHRFGTDNRPLCKVCARLDAAGR